MLADTKMNPSAWEWFLALYRPTCVAETEHWSWHRVRVENFQAVETRYW